MYVNSDDPPDWLLRGVRELSWIFHGHPGTMAFINAAMEVADKFVIEKEDEITIEEIRELNYTIYPPLKVISILEDSYIIEREGNIIKPGVLTKRLIATRKLNLPLDSLEQQQRGLEYQAMLAITLLRTMLDDNSFFPQGLPQGALATMTLLAAHGLRSDSKIEAEVSALTWVFSFQRCLTPSGRKNASSNGRIARWSRQNDYRHR